MKNPKASAGMSSRWLFILITTSRCVIKLKKEFLDPKERSMMVSEYAIHFIQLSCYAPNDVDTDEKKQECFLNGLDEGLAYALEA
jgi:hypothetical protein